MGCPESALGAWPVMGDFFFAKVGVYDIYIYIIYIYIIYIIYIYNIYICKPPHIYIIYLLLYISRHIYTHIDRYSNHEEKCVFLISMLFIVLLQHETCFHGRGFGNLTIIPTVEGGAPWYATFVA